MIYTLGGAAAAVAAAAVAVAAVDAGSSVFRQHVDGDGRQRQHRESGTDSQDL